MTRLELKDFGPIAKASVELKPLTVFIGPNNSGKSYLALAIYALSRAITAPLSRLSPFLWGRRLSFERPMPEARRASEAIRAAWPDARSFPSQAMTVKELPPSVQKLISSGLKANAESLSHDLAGELQRCYGTAISGLNRRGSGVEASALQLTLRDDQKGLLWQMRSSREELLTSKWDSDLSKLTVDFSGGSRLRGSLRDDPEYFLYHFLLRLPNTLLPYLSTEAHYMPASRSGILLGHKTLASLIVGRASLAWVEPMDIPRLPGVITDLIQALLLLRRTQRLDTKLQKVVSFLEGEVTRGTVDIDPSLEYPEIFYENETGRFQLHQASSMVSEVAPFVLFVKYLVRPGHLFIIEEPESHLDAGNQRNLARAIAMLVNAGVKVLITTHSDYFVNQINNCLLLSQLTPRRRAARKYAANEVLSADDVGAYLFSPGDRGTSVEALNITADYGIPTKMFTDVHSTLYNEAIVLEHSRQ